MTQDDRQPGATENLPGCAFVVFGVLPLMGFASEILTGAFSSFQPLFPTWWHVVAVTLAIIANLALHLGALRRPEAMVMRACVVGFVAGMALLYAIAEWPELAWILAGTIIGLGVLAAAPFFVLAGMGLLIPSLYRDWSASGRPASQCTAMLLVLALAPIGTSLFVASTQLRIAHKLSTLAKVMHEGGQPGAEEALAESLRSLDLAAQRSICLFGSNSGYERRLTRSEPGSFQHLANGRPMWFEVPGRAERVSAKAARRAFHRAHGEAFDRGELPFDSRSWVDGADLDWRSSKVAAIVEPDAALARVDWLLVVGSRRSRPAEARFDIRLPAGAVTSSLSLTIDGEERPAAFAAAGEVTKAFEAVVATMRIRRCCSSLGQIWCACGCFRFRVDSRPCGCGSGLLCRCVCATAPRFCTCHKS